MEKDLEKNEDVVVETSDELAEFGDTPIFRDEEIESFLPELNDLEASDELPAVVSAEGTELEQFETAEIEDVEFLEEERLESILESILFASDRPVSLASLKLVFKGTNVTTQKIKRALDRFAVELAGAQRGVSLEEVPGGYQLRTKIDNMNFISRTLKARPFRLSGPALEVLAIVAYKQPIVKSEIDEIRGVESGHLLRALMERNLVTFEGKSDLPGKPMLYGTTKKFMEVFGLRNLKELPTLSQIDELLPEGITEAETTKPTLSTLTDSLSESISNSYSQGEEELMKITTDLETISTSSDFFEQEKVRQKQKRDADKAQSIREAILVGEEVSNRDKNWLARYDEAQMLGQKIEDFEKDQDSHLASSDDVNIESESEVMFEETDLADIDGENENNGEVSI